MSDKHGESTGDSKREEESSDIKNENEEAGMEEHKSEYEEDELTKNSDRPTDDNDNIEKLSSDSDGKIKDQKLEEQTSKSQEDATLVVTIYQDSKRKEESSDIKNENEEAGVKKCKSEYQEDELTKYSAQSTDDNGNIEKPPSDSDLKINPQTEVEVWAVGFQEDATGNNFAEPIPEGQGDEIADLRRQITDLQRDMARMRDDWREDLRQSNEHLLEGIRRMMIARPIQVVASQPSDDTNALELDAVASEGQQSNERGRNGPSVEFTEEPEINNGESSSTGLAAGNDSASEPSNVNSGVIDEARDNVQGPGVDNQDMSGPAAMPENDEDRSEQ